MQRQVRLVAIRLDAVQALVVVLRRHHQDAELAGGVGQFVLVRLVPVHLGGDGHGLGLDLDRLHVDLDMHRATGVDDLDGDAGRLLGLLGDPVNHLLLAALVQAGIGSLEVAQLEQGSLDQVVYQQFVGQLAGQRAVAFGALDDGAVFHFHRRVSYWLAIRSSCSSWASLR
ncbi:hypothetical protein FQZ97_820840 [compost metagenome]